ncbi:MAG: ChbG/HpnK family deacetylase [Terracidiphilus sp.]|nr:ChbG/HpnK family deacetylase [Terracidiphilus sp.]
MSRLIVNADDFGLTSGVNRAILELHGAGVLTSATLMARATASAEAIAMARATPSLGVGCHVVLVDGDPVLPPHEIPTLIDRRTGRFHPTLGAFLQRLLTGRILAAEIEAEAAAQLSLLQAQGLALTHMDTHKHVHMFPAVLRPVLRAAASGGIRRIRNPFEPAWSLNATPGAPWLRRTQVHLLRRFLPAFDRIVDSAGFTTTDGVIGVLATGTLDAATVDSVLRNMPHGTWELVTHPGYNDDNLARARTRLLASREAELEALLILRQFPEIEFISFMGLHSNARLKTSR